MDREEEPQQRTIELLLGFERLRDATMRATMRGTNAAREAADQALPPDVTWTPRPVAAPAADAEIEPIAMHAPEESFYVRFGSFSNYLWYSGLLGEYGGDLGRMVTLRGHSPRLNERMQRQLVCENRRWRDC